LPFSRIIKLFYCRDGLCKLLTPYFNTIHVIAVRHVFFILSFPLNNMIT